LQQQKVAEIAEKKHFIRKRLISFDHSDGFEAMVSTPTVNFLFA